jgi:hypothetical protein
VVIFLTIFICTYIFFLLIFFYFREFLKVPGSKVVRYLGRYIVTYFRIQTARKD